MHSHITFVLNLDTSTFRYIVGSLESGLRGLDANILSQVHILFSRLLLDYFKNYLAWFSLSLSYPCILLDLLDSGLRPFI